MRARASAADWSAQLYYYLKEARETWGGMHICEGAPLSPPESAAAGTLLSVCCSARRRTVLAMSFECGHDLGRSRGLRLAIVTAMWGSWRAEPEVRSADATSVRCDALIACTRESTVNSQYSSVLESLPMILSVLSVSDCG